MEKTVNLRIITVGQIGYGIKKFLTMKIVCISKKLPGRTKEEYLYLAIGKIYDCLINQFKDDPMIKIKDDNGEVVYYHKKCFETLEINRYEKLNELGI